MTLTPNTQITQENVGLLKAGDVREIATSMNLVLSGSWDEAQDCDWSGKGNEEKLDRLDELLGDLLDALDRPALSPPAEGLGHTDLMISPEAIDAFLATGDHPLITPTPAPADHIGDVTEKMAVQVGPFAPSFYDELLAHAWTALRERKPFEINADGAIAIITQAKADRAALAPTQPQSNGE